MEVSADRIFSLDTTLLLYTHRMSRQCGKPSNAFCPKCIPVFSRLVSPSFSQCHDRRAWFRHDVTVPLTPTPPRGRHLKRARKTFSWPLFRVTGRTETGVLSRFPVPPKAADAYRALCMCALNIQYRRKPALQENVSLICYNNDMNIQFWVTWKRGKRNKEEKRKNILLFLYNPSLGKKLQFKN